MKRISFKFAVKILVVALIIAVGLEMALRLREKLRTRVGGVYPNITYQHNQLRHALIPNAEYFGRVEINSLGFRGPDFSIEKPAGTIRIVCLGGSTTFDTYVSSNERMWTKELERILKEKYPDAEIEVINAGVVGYRVMDSLINLQTRILSLSPDIIVLYHAHNDINANRLEYLPTDYDPRPGAVETETSLEAWLRENSVLFQKASLFLAYLPWGGSARQIQRQDEISLQGLANFEQNLSLLAFSCAENGIRLVMPNVITGFRQEMPRDAQFANAKWALLFCRHLTLTGIYSAYAQYNQAIARIAERFGGLFVEGTKEIPGGPEYFADGVHFTDLGAAKFAEILATEIRAKGLLADSLSGTSFQTAAR